MLSRIIQRTMAVRTIAAPGRSQVDTRGICSGISSDLRRKLFRANPAAVSVWNFASPPPSSARSVWIAVQQAHLHGSDGTWLKT